MLAVRMRIPLILGLLAFQPSAFADSWWDYLFSLTTPDEPPASSTLTTESPASYTLTTESLASYALTAEPPASYTLTTESLSPYTLTAEPPASYTLTTESLYAFTTITMSLTSDLDAVCEGECPCAGKVVEKQIAA